MTGHSRAGQVAGEDRRFSPLGAAALAALLAAGIVLACSWFVPFPGLILAAAWLIAVAAMAVVVVSAFRESRAAGTGFFTAIGRSIKALGKFIVSFF
jgi:hypothetical protein